MTDRSFVRFGGLAGILLAITSWAAVAAYYTLAKGGQDMIGLQIFQLLNALIAFWALFGIVAVHWTVRQHGEAWSFFAALIGVAAAMGTIASSLYGAAILRELIAHPELRAPNTAPTDPLNVTTFALTGLWLLIADLLLWRAGSPRPLVALGLVTVAALFIGFFASLSGRADLVSFCGAVAGAIGAPLFWLWLGLRLRRARP